SHHPQGGGRGRGGAAGSGARGRARAGPSCRRARPRPHGRKHLMAELAAGARRWKKPPFIKSPLLRWGLGVGFAFYLALAFGTTDVDWGRVAEGIPRGWRFVAGFFPPDFASRWDSI